jgi:hypothetical protein
MNVEAAVSAAHTKTSNGNIQKADMGLCSDLRKNKNQALS